MGVGESVTSNELNCHHSIIYLNQTCRTKTHEDIS